jgi:hypothetical protein
MSDRKDLVVSAAGIVSEATFGAASLTTMSNLSGAIMYATARRFALEAAAGRSEPPPALPLATVIMVCTALESFVNEELALEATWSPATAHAAESLRAVAAKRLRHRTVWRRYLALHGKKFQEQKEPYRAFDRLVELRNLLIHRAARFYGPHQMPNEVTDVAKYFTFNPSNGTFVAWEQRVLNANCARWACNAAAALRAEHFKLLGRADVAPWETLPPP